VGVAVQMTEQLAGRVALVSGASRGIGRVIAGELASRGAAVALTARDEDALAHVVEELATGDGQVMAVPGDLAHGGVPASIVSRVTAVPSIKRTSQTLNRRSRSTWSGPLRWRGRCYQG
jgi:NAD(P)-dependent dehydrogenase (short-subunit alcohol dehydrogenase family)